MSVLQGAIVLVVGLALGIAVLGVWAFAILMAESLREGRWLP